MLALQEDEEPTTGTYVHLGLSFHRDQEATKFYYTFDDDDSTSLGISVKSGLRNSLQSSFEFDDLDDISSSEESSVANDEGKSDQPNVSWREDVTESGSDWTMAIESVPDGTVVEYAVHKHILARGSEFFARLFALSAAQKVENDGHSLTKVHSNAATLIPEMLDFLYSTHYRLEITTETAVIFRHLSEFFGIRALAAQSYKFIHSDMHLDNVTTYLTVANSFDDLQTQKLAAKICAENIDSIEPYSEILAGMEPSFLLDVISTPRENRDQFSIHISVLVTAYCDMCGDLIDGTVFQELTTVEYLPIVSSECAIDLMILEEQVVDDAGDESRGLTHLQERCCAVLAPVIKLESESNERQGRRLQDQLECLPRKVVENLLSLSLGIRS